MRLLEALAVEDRNAIPFHRAARRAETRHEQLCRASSLVKPDGVIPHFPELDRSLA